MNFYSRFSPLFSTPLAVTVIVIAVIAHIIAAWFSEGNFHADEYWQIMHFAALKLGRAELSEMPWEYETQIRPALMPSIAFAFSKIMPSLADFSLRLLSATISLAGALLFLSVFLRECGGGKNHLFVLFFTLLLWSAVFSHVRFSAENWGGALFLIALGGYFLRRDNSRRALFLVGFVFGLAFVARYQIALMILGFALWLIYVRRISLREAALLSAGSLCAIVLGVALDCWLYEQWTLTAWNYFRFHILESGINTASREPLWHYAEKSALYTLPPASIAVPALVAAFCFFRPKHPIMWIAAPYILFHHLIENKQIRFMIPMLPFLPFMAAVAAAKIGEILRQTAFNKIFFRRAAKGVLYFSVALNFLLLPAVLFVPANLGMNIIQYWKTQIPPDAKIAVQDIRMSTHDVIQPYYLERELKNRLVKVSDEAELARLVADTPLFYAARKNRDNALREAGLNFSLVYISLPDWARAININNWQSRASIWRIYRIEKQ